MTPSNGPETTRPRRPRILETLVRDIRYVGRSEHRVFPRWVEAYLPWIVFVVSVVYIVTSAYSMRKTGAFTWTQLAPFITLIILGLAFGVWFIVALQVTRRTKRGSRIDAAVRVFAFATSSP